MINITFPHLVFYKYRIQIDIRSQSRQIIIATETRCPEANYFCSTFDLGAIA